MSKTLLNKINNDKEKETHKIINSIFILLYYFLLYYIGNNNFIKKLNNMNKIILNHFKKAKKVIINIRIGLIIELKKIKNNIINIIKCMKIKFNNNKIFYINNNKYLNIKINKIFILNYFILIKIVSIKSSSQITLFFEGNINSQILNDDFIHIPSEIFVNNINQNNSLYKVDNLNIGTNNITIRWNYEITSCTKMFYGLNNIKSIDFSKFDTSYVDNMDDMFYECSSLKSLDLSNFKTSNVKSMGNMFYKCTSLESLDLSNFNTSNVKLMANMFDGCSSLKSLNLSHFDTSYVENMGHMFNGCYSLKSLELSNFNTLNVQLMDNMFNGCSSLTFLDLSSFITQSLLNTDSMFFNCSSLISISFGNFDTSKVSSMEKMFSNCQSLTTLNLSSFITINTQTLSQMLYNCSNLQFINISNFVIPGDIPIDGIIDLTPENLVICAYQNITSLKKIISSKPCLSIDCSFNWKESQKIIIDINDACLAKCSNDEIFFSYEYENRCYQQCKKESFSTEYCSSNILLNNIILTKDIYSCNLKDYFLGKCILNNVNQNEHDEIINYIKNEIINRGLNELITEVVQNEKKDLLIQNDNLLYQITSSENQIKNKNNNYSSILLGNCENLLRNIYNISENYSLIIFKIDYYNPGVSIPSIGYEIYHPLNKSKLDLNICNNESIKFNIPVIINENNLYKYDPNNEYYKDICIPSTSESETDILMNDRYKEFNNNNYSLCENECNYNGYDIEAKKAKCECGIKSKELVISELINQTNNLYHNFTNKEESLNMITMKCYYVLFTKEGLATNIGSYILIFITIFFMISAFLFYKCGFLFLEEDINEIIQFKEKNNNKHKKDMNKKEMNDNVKKYLKKNVNSNKKQKKINKSKKINRSKKLKIKNDNICSNSFEKLKIQNSNNVIPYKVGENSKPNDVINDNNMVIQFNDYELNSMPYNIAIIYDKRNYFNYYFSLVSLKNAFIFSFCPKKDYNSKIIKICLFFLFFAIYYFINALLFDEPTIHKIYEDKGTYNFIYLLPHICYSFVISHTLNTIIKYIFLSERNIIKIKIEKNIDKVYDYRENIKKCLVIKYILFFIIGLIFLIYFWYYLSSFGAVYKNSQFYLIKNTAISFGFSLIYPFIINIFPCILRICSLKGKKNECKYKISKLIQII